jgi:hypothetical protein
MPLRVTYTRGARACRLRSESTAAEARAMGRAGTLGTRRSRARRALKRYLSGAEEGDTPAPPAGEDEEMGAAEFAAAPVMAAMRAAEAAKRDSAAAAAADGAPGPVKTLTAELVGCSAGALDAG